MSGERSLAGRNAGAVVGSAQWRAGVEGEQELALPGPGRVLVTAPAPFGAGGLGRHLNEIIDALERRGQQSACICESQDRALVAGQGRDLRVAALTRALRPLGRVSPAWRLWLTSIRFDADAARRLPEADHLVAFNGTALAQFRAAARARYESSSLVSANSHMRRVVRQHAKAHRAFPLERPSSTRVLRRNLREYALADRIYVASQYIWESFVEEGFPEEVLSRFPLTPHPRYEAAPRDAADTFDIVYVGSLTVHKGVPLLLRAVRRLPYPDLRLVLVGGWRSRGMRRFIETARGEDPRIVVAPGDPLAHLQRARLCVHPAYEDGFAYAPAEAMACGVPVLVSEDTGMKELVAPGVNGLILPTGDAGQLSEAIDAVYRRELLAR
jgi:glycosyltransferase involved in cell wall biosynthesis